MPLYTKISPVGVDIQVQRKQELLWNALRSRWSLADDMYKSYGRSYRNQREAGYVPEMYEESTTLGKEYKELFIDDKVILTSFFTINNEKVLSSGLMQADGYIIFIVDLTKIGKTTLHRPDNEARQDVYNLLKFKAGFVVTEVITGIDKVFSEYSAWRSTTGGVNYTDMHPNHCFRINFSITYSPDTNCLPIFN